MTMTYTPIAVHLLHPNNPKATVCQQFPLRRLMLTTNPEETTCKRCLSWWAKRKHQSFDISNRWGAWPWDKQA